ncbi:MAG: extracellular solute-binding protein [Clostridia bacterium]|nr:extracellular solute-binding protein [Clostridia bacterium]
MKKLTSLLLILMMLLPAAALGEEWNPAIYVDKSWDILTAAHEEPVEITIWIPNTATSTMGTGIQALADKFNEEQQAQFPGKNITVIVEYQNKSGTLNEKLQAAILSGNNPVISAVGVSSVPLYEARALDLRQVFTYEELQAQSQGMMQYSLYNGKYMLTPYFPSASNIIIYNKTLMEKSGAVLPTAEEILNDPAGSGWTWDAFKEAAKKVTNVEEGIYGFASNSLDPVGMMFQQGGALYNSTVTELKFVGDERFAKGLEFWRSLVTEGCMLNPNSRSNHGTIIVSEFYEQKVGMIYTTSSNVVKFTDEAAKNGYEIGVLPFPKETQYFTNQGGSGIIILNNRPIKEQQAAAEFLRWLLKPENNAYMCAVSGYLPLANAAHEDQALADVYAKTPLLETVARFMEFGITSPQGKAKAACDKAVNDYCKLIWSEPDMLIDEIVSQVTKKAMFEIEANQ